MEPSPRLLPEGPLELVSARTLFSGGAPRRRSAASVVRLSGSGRLLLVYSEVPGASLGNDAALMLSRSDDEGENWQAPIPLYAYPGWFCLAMGGLARLADGDVKLILGRIRIDLSLGGTEPIDGWHVAATTSRDGGANWSEPGPEIRLFPHWTEMYGASNPHQVADGRLLWACMGTMGRDEGWHAGVTFSSPDGERFEQPTIIAQEPGRDYSDIDVVRLPGGRLLAVIREHRTLQSVQSHSDDEGRTWTPLRPTPFKGSNIKLHRLRSGIVLCAYRDEEPQRRGVSCSVTEDGGRSWRFVGQLYAAGSEALHQPGSVCGYPDAVELGDGTLAFVLHTYPSQDGVELHWLRLRERE